MENIRIITKKVKNNNYGQAESRAYKGKEEIGLIIMKVTGSEFRIDEFKVKEKERNKEIGRKLLKEMVSEVNRLEGTEIIIYPNSSPYPEDNKIEIETLYHIYKGKFGFLFEEDYLNNKESVQIPNKKMFLIVNKTSD